MIKTTAVFSIHAIHEFLRNIIIVFVLVLLALFIWLKVGIEAESLEIGPYKVSGLYIKLDKKLSLTAHDVIVPASKADPSFESVDETFEHIKTMLSFFEYIALHDIIYKNNRIDFIFANNLLHINTQDYEIAGRIGRKGSNLQAEVPLLYLKKDKIAIGGRITYNFLQDRLHTWGRYEMSGIKGKFTANKIKNKISFDLQSDVFSDLGPVVEKLPLKESITQWPGRRVLAKRYKLRSLRGGGEIKGKSFKLDFDALKGELDMEDVTINFKDGVDSVNATKVIMEYRNGGLYFALHDPNYLGRDLNQSSLSIVDLVGGKPTTLKLDLHVNALLDEEMQKILNAYKLKIPILQESGSAKTIVALDVVLKTGDVNAVVDTQMEDAHIQLYKIDLGIEKGSIHYADNKVILHDIVLKDKNYKANIQGTIALKTQNAKLDANVDYIYLGTEKERSFVLKDKKLDLMIDYRDEVEVKVPKLSLTIHDTKKQTQIIIDDLTLIKPYIQNSALIQEGGNVKILTEDFKHLSFEGILRRNSCFFYEGDNICATRVACEGKVSSEGIDFYAFNKRFHYNEPSSRINLKELNIDLEKFIDYQKSLQQSGSATIKENKSLVIIGKQSNLRYKEYTLVMDRYDIEVKPNGDVHAMGSTQENIVKFDKKGNRIFLEALRIQDKALHPLINFDGLSEGRYSLKLAGDPDGTMEGKIIIEGGVMKNFKAYNNTLAFLNTLPALATLQDPGFSTQGYKINKGIAQFRVVESKKIIFDSIYIQGDSSTIAGTGEIDLEKKTIDIKMAIQTAKKLGEVVGNIPLLGYILMGENKSVTIGLTITGTMDKPEVKTTAATDVLSLPIQLIKRTLESPVKMIDKKENIQTPETQESVSDKKEKREEEKPQDINKILETL